MKILGPNQIKLCDEYAIEHIPISSIDLMERAATLCTDYIIQKLPKPDKTIIFCGKGNNGGDGLAIARMLLQENYPVEVIILEHSQKSSADFEENRKRFKGSITEIHSANELQVVATKNTLIIDALIGNSLNKPLHGLVKNIVEMLNTFSGYKLAIDIPTGLFSDSQNIESLTIFKADTTLTFQAPKLSFLMKENYPFVGNFIILNIGWPKDADKDVDTNFYFTSKEEIAAIYHKRQKFVSKHDFGHALIIAGSYGKLGAELLSTKACLRSGAGLTTTYSPKCAYQILQAETPEAMCITDPNDEYISELPDLKKYNAIGVGPGIGLNDKTKLVVEQLIHKCDVSLIIDADAINILAEKKSLLNFLKPNTIITPHTKEFERLTFKCKNDFEKLQAGIDFAKKYSIIVILKGVYTAVINSDGKVFFNSTGNSALAKGGSGDVLTGIITAILAMGYSPLNASILSVYIHGLAADICIEQQSKETVIASDLIMALQKSYLKISEY